MLTTTWINWKRNNGLCKHRNVGVWLFSNTFHTYTMGYKLFTRQINDKHELVKDGKKSTRESDLSDDLKLNGSFPDLETRCALQMQFTLPFMDLRATTMGCTVSPVTSSMAYLCPFTNLRYCFLFTRQEPWCWRPGKSPTTGFPSQHPLAALKF